MQSGYDNPLPEAAETVAPSPRVRRARALRGRTFWLSGLLGGVAVLALGVKFPQEVMKLRENQATIRKLQEENADLRKLRDERQARIEELRRNSDLLELEIERNLKLYPKGHYIFRLPERGDEGRQRESSKSN